MRFFIDRAYASAPAKDRILCTNSPELLEKLKALGLEDRKDQALHVLVGYDLIELEPLPMSVTSRIVLTGKGMAYFERKRDDMISLICKSILIPILVSIITAAITVYILPSLGKQANRWLQHTTQDIPQSKTESAPPDDRSGNPSIQSLPSTTPHPEN